MSLCLATPAMALSLAVQSFTLSWTHSVERTEWREQWQVQGHNLSLVEARVRGSGAGMDPAEGAILKEGWWVWPGRIAPQPALRLAVSGATGSGWTWCARGFGCHDLERWLARRGKPPALIEISASPARCRPLTETGERRR